MLHVAFSMSHVISIWFYKILNSYIKWRIKNTMNSIIFEIKELIFTTVITEDGCKLQVICFNYLIIIFESDLILITIVQNAFLRENCFCFLWWNLHCGDSFQASINDCFEQQSLLKRVFNITSVRGCNFAQLFTIILGWLNKDLVYFCSLGKTTPSKKYLANHL